MSQQDLDQIRAIAQRLAKRIREDQAFREQVLSDPNVLLREDLPEHVVADLLRSTDLIDVAGYLGCSSISAI